MPADSRVTLRSRVASALLAVLCCLLSPFPAGASADGNSLELEQQWAWSTLGRLTPRGELKAADLDRDGRLEILAPSRGIHGGLGAHWQELVYDGHVAQRWSSPPATFDILGLELIYKKERVEIAVALADRIDIFDGDSKSLLRSLPMPGSSLVGASDASLRAGDVDADGATELVLCTGWDLFVLDAESGSVEHSLLGFGCSDADVGQADGDAPLEIVLAGNPFGGFVLDGASLTVQFADLDGFGSSVRFFNADTDSIAEILAVEPFPGAVRALRSADGEMIWSRNLEGDAVVTVADLDSDGASEVLVGEQTALRILEASTGDELWFVPSLVSEPEPMGLIVGDLDGDGSTEILWALVTEPFAQWSATEWIGVDVATRSEESRLHSPALSTGIEAADLDADGRLELLGTYSRTSQWIEAGRTITLDPFSRVVRSLGSTLPPLHRATAIRSVAAQLDADVPLETCTSFTGVALSAVRCEDSESLDEQWRVEFPIAEGADEIYVLEIDGGGYPEVVVATASDNIYAFEGESGELKWRSSDLSSGPPRVLHVEAADVTGGAEPEILAIIDGFGAFVVFDSLTGVPLAGPFETFATTFTTAELDSDLQLDVVAAMEYGEVIHFDAMTGTFLEPIATLPDRAQSLFVGDLNRDEIEDLAILVEGRLLLFDGIVGGLAWESEPLVGFGEGTLRVADVDHDSLRELIVSARERFVILEAPPSLYFSDGFESGDTSAWSSTLP